MATIRVSYANQQSNTRTGGWSENFWLNAGTIAAAEPIAQDLYFSLHSFKGNPTYIPRYRLSAYPSNRLAKVVLTGSSPTAATGGALDADYPTTRVQLKLTGQAPQSTLVWLGGLRDDAVTRGGFWTPGGAVAGQLATIAAKLTNGANGWSINVLNPAVLPVVINTINATTGQITTAVPHGLVTGDKVRVARVHGIAGINGVWKVILVDTTNFTLVGWKSSTDVMTRSPSATVRKQSPILQQITAVEVVQVTSHRVGKPGGLLGGRRKRPSSSLVGPVVVK